MSPLISALVVKSVKPVPALGSDILTATTISPWQTFGITLCFKASEPKCSITFTGPAFASKTGQPTAEDIFPNSSKPPKITLPFILGLEYSKVTSVNPTFCSTFWKGLGAGVWIWAFVENEIEINPGQRLSYQYHNNRSEVWTIIKGKGSVTLDGKINNYKKGDTILIPKGAKHRIENNGKDKIVFIEVQTGSYFGEDDIVRLEDDYNR